jgi:hypothetical protein
MIEYYKLYIICNIVPSFGPKGDKGNVKSGLMWWHIMILILEWNSLSVSLKYMKQPTNIFIYLYVDFNLNENHTIYTFYQL